MSPTTTTLAYHLRRLSRAELRAFVVDLWAARGFESAGEADVAVAGDGRVRVDASGPPADGSSGAADGASAERVVDVERLAEMVLYAVEPSDARRLCVDHLGTPPHDLRPPPATRARRRAARARERVGRLAAAGPPAPVVGIVLVLVGAAVLAGLPALSGPGEDPELRNASAADAGGADGDSMAVRSAYPSPPVGGFDVAPGEDGRADAAEQRDCHPTQLQRLEGNASDGTARFACVT